MGRTNLLVTGRQMKEEEGWLVAAVGERECVKEVIAHFLRDKSVENAKCE